MTDKQKEQRVKILLKQGLSVRKIAHALAISRYEAGKIINGTGEKKVESVGSVVELEPLREQIVRWLEEQHLTARLIHKRIIEKGIDISYSTVVRYLKPFNKKEVYVPVISKPGEEAQVDFGYFGLFNKEGKKVKVCVFNMVLSFSRYAFYEIVTDQSVRTFLDCHSKAFEFFKGVPASIKIDNLGAGVLEADFYEATIQQRYNEFLAYYGTTAITARICRGQDKGKVEAGIKYVKYNFLKSITHRDYKQLADNLANWIKQECNLRQHGTTKKIPLEQYQKFEKKTLIELPQERCKSVESEQRKVNHYGHVYFRKNYYSVPHHYTGEQVVVQTNGTTIKISYNLTLIAMHPLCSESGRFITVEEHKPFHKRLKTEAYYFEKAEEIGTDATRLLQLMQVEKPFHWKVMMRGIFTLKKLYNNTTINRACEAATLSGSNNYKKVKWCCQREFQESDPKQFIIKGTHGYYHDLSIYDQLVNKV